MPLNIQDKKGPYQADYEAILASAKIFMPKRGQRTGYFDELRGILQKHRTNLESITEADYREFCEKIDGRLASDTKGLRMHDAPQESIL